MWLSSGSLPGMHKVLAPTRPARLQINKEIKSSIVQYPSFCYWLPLMSPRSTPALAHIRMASHYRESPARLVWGWESPGHTPASVLLPSVPCESPGSSDTPTKRGEGRYTHSVPQSLFKKSRKSRQQKQTFLVFRKSEAGVPVSSLCVCLSSGIHGCLPALGHSKFTLWTHKQSSSAPLSMSLTPHPVTV